jgi:hypothetical protein
MNMENIAKYIIFAGVVLILIGLVLYGTAKSTFHLVVCRVIFALRVRMVCFIFRW